jgi:DNA-binding NtrC family response regulator
VEISFLVVDDDEMIRDLFSKSIKIRGCKCFSAKNGKEALEILNRNRIDIIFADMRMPVMNGMQLLKKVKKEYPHIEVIMITGYGSIEDAVEAMKNGASDYIIKPFRPDEIILKIIETEERKTKHSPPVCIAESDSMKKIIKKIDKISPTDSHILIYGESGVGKEIVGELIHTFSKRKAQPFVKINCAGLDESTLENVIFGSEKTTFTGTVSVIKGKLESADKGTLFLDEIASTSASIQNKLLSFLEQDEFKRVNGEKPLKADVRIIVTTTRNLRERVKNGKFNESLFHYLNSIRIDIPPLRERKKDIIPLVQHFLKRFSTTKNSFNITSEIKSMLLSYEWPGNVRELKSAIERAVIFSNGFNINPGSLFLQDESLKDKEGIFTLKCPSFTFNDFEKTLLLKVLRNANWNIQQSAKVLKISEKTLDKKVKKHKLQIYKKKEEDSTIHNIQHHKDT